FVFVFVCVCACVWGVCVCVCVCVCVLVCWCVSMCVFVCVSCEESWVLVSVLNHTPAGSSNPQRVVAVSVSFPLWLWRYPWASLFVFFLVHRACSATAMVAQ